jgi:hypothetical protein
VTDEELIEGLSFPCFRRVATMIMVPAAPPHHSSTEMIFISSVDLADARQADAIALQMNKRPSQIESTPCVQQ